MIDYAYMKNILSLDIGTTSTRAVIFNHKMNILAQFSLPLNINTQETGEVEQDPVDIYHKTVQCGKKAIQAAKLKSRDIDCIGLANQRETIVAWNRQTGQLIAPAIVWQDRRTARKCRSLENDRALARRIKAKTGLVIDPSFSATKIQWLNNKYNPKQNKKIIFGTIDSWMLWNLTKGQVFSTEPSNASRTMLLNIKTLAWDAELLELFDLQNEQLPDIQFSQGEFGLCDQKIFGRAIPITGILGDQQAALFSHGPLRENMLSMTYGTGLFALKTIGHMPRPAASGILTTVAWKRPKRPVEYAYETSALTGGAMLEWFKNQMNLVKDMKEFDALAETVTTTGGVTIVPAFTGLAAPDWDPTARGLIIGLNRGTTKAHLCRAAIEAIACQATRMAKLLDEQMGLNSKYWKVSGGLCNSHPLMQSQADMSNVKICKEKNVESTAAGAAMIAGLGAGLWPTWKDVSRQITCHVVYKPKRLKRGRAFLAQYERALERSKAWEI